MLRFKLSNAVLVAHAVVNQAVWKTNTLYYYEYLLYGTTALEELWLPLLENEIYFKNIVLI